MTSNEPEGTTPPSPRRQGYIKGLRQLADLLEQQPTLPLPYYGQSPHPFAVAFYGMREREQLAAFAAALTDPSEGADGDTYRIEGKLAGLHLAAGCAAQHLGREVTRERTEFEVEPILSTVTA